MECNDSVSYGSERAIWVLAKAITIHVFSHERWKFGDAVVAAPGGEEGLGLGLDFAGGLGLADAAAGEDEVEEVFFAGAAVFGVGVEAEEGGGFDGEFTHFVFGADVGEDGSGGLAVLAVDDPAEIAFFGSAPLATGEDEEGDGVGVHEAGGVVFSCA